MTAMPSLRRVNALYTMVQLTYWAAFAGYQTALLLGRGFSSGEAGAFAAIRCLAGILAQPLLGGWADRHPKVPLKHILRLCLAVSLAVNGVFYCTRPGFWGTALIFLALGVLELNAYPLLDSMAVPVHQCRSAGQLQPGAGPGLLRLRSGLRGAWPAGRVSGSGVRSFEPHGSAGGTDRNSLPLSHFPRPGASIRAHRRSSSPIPSAFSCAPTRPFP